MAKRKKAKPPPPAPPPTGSEPRRSLEEIERSLREAEIVSMAPVGTGHMNVGGESKSLPDKYLEMVRALQRPSLEQSYRFAWFVAEALSWYKHLPADQAVPFVFYLDPYAGWSEVTTVATGEVALQEITDESTRFHYTWQTTADYRRRFGHWDYTMDKGASISDGDGNRIAVPRSFLKAGRADVNAFMHENMLNWFGGSPPGEEPPKFLNDPRAAAFATECGPPDGLAAPFQTAVDERLQRAAACLDEDQVSWFGKPWFDESWDKAFAAMGGTIVELDTALSWFQRRLLVTWAQRISGKDGSEIPVAFAYERNRQLDEMRFAMLRVLDLTQPREDKIMSNKVDDNCDDRPSSGGVYVLSAQDRGIVAATRLLLRKISRLPGIKARQAEAVANVLGVFERLPRISEESNIAVSLAGPRHSYGEHKISHWWRIAVTGNELEVSSGGDFYRPSTGGDSFTCMEWQAAPGYEANYDDYLDRHQIVDDAQPYEIEVARLAITEPGYWLSIEWDGEELDSEEDEEREEELNEEPEPPMADDAIQPCEESERTTSYYFWKWADNGLPGKPPDVLAALLRGEPHPALQSFDARSLLNAVEEAAAEGRVVGEEWKWELHPAASPEKTWFVIVTCPRINTSRERAERFIDRFSPLGLSGCDDEGKLIPGFFPKLNYFVTGQLSDRGTAYDIRRTERKGRATLLWALRPIHWIIGEPVCEYNIEIEDEVIVAQGRPLDLLS